MLQDVAVCCTALQCVAVRCSALQCVAVCCSVLQCVAVCCIVLQCVAVCCSVLYSKESAMLHCVACVAVSCNLLYEKGYQKKGSKKKETDQKPDLLKGLCKKEDLEMRKNPSKGPSNQATPTKETLR